MATPDRDSVYNNDTTNRTVYARESNSTGWFVGIIVALALLAIAYLVFSANSQPSTSTVDINNTPAVTTPAPADTTTTPMAPADNTTINNNVSAAPTAPAGDTTTTTPSTPATDATGVSSAAPMASDVTSSAAPVEASSAAQ